MKSKQQIAHYEFAQIIIIIIIISEFVIAFDPSHSFIKIRALR